jgi:polysaccharide biosynthesis protein PelF
MEKNTADVCIIVEGAYPYVNGGVSSWVQNLITALDPLTFHVVALKADDREQPRRFTLPKNVLCLSEIALQPSRYQSPNKPDASAVIDSLELPLQSLLCRGTVQDFRKIINVLHLHKGRISRADLLNSEAAFAMLQRMYESTVPESSFLQYFWSWRSLVGGLFSVLLADLPPARVYHAVSTGYAGLLLARAVVETKRHGILTEHGIYTNERRIEIAMAEWLADRGKPSLEIVKHRRDLRDVWLDAFIGYSQTCYELSSRIITLYRGNQAMQLRDGALPERMALIPNGIDVAFFAKVDRQKQSKRPTIAMIGRVVQIKDVKTYIRAAALLRIKLPQLRALVIGPTEEDPIYYEECRDMVAHLDLGECIEFTGQVRLVDYLAEVDVVVLTSISEAQPLVLLEAGAAGIPAVATDVGACRDIIEGQPDESPALGPGGFITALANPQATATAVANLLLDPALLEQFGEVMRKRTQRYYSKEQTNESYRMLYESYMTVVAEHPTSEAL